MRYVAGIILLVVSALCSACSTAPGAGPASVQDRSHLPNPYNSYNDFVSLHTFPYTIDPERKMLILNNYDRVSLGMTREDIRFYFGKPDYVVNAYTRDYPGRYLGSTWTYYFFKPESGAVHEKQDAYLGVFFGPDDKARWMIPRNIEELTEKTGPQQR